MRAFACYLFLAVASIAAVSCRPDKEPGTERLTELAREAYIYAFPAVEHNKAVWSILEGSKTPVNRFAGRAELYTYEDKVIVTPNNDTYYFQAILDIRNEPVVVSVPEIKERYFSIQLCDIFTGCPDYIGTLATGDGPGNYMIARKDWNGEVPGAIDEVIRIPATLVMALARTQVFGADDTQAGEIARSYKAVTLSEFAGTQPPAGDAIVWDYEKFDAKTGDVEGFFRMFNEMVQYQILDDNDKVLMKKFKAIGLEPGSGFKASQFDREAWTAIEEGANMGKADILTVLNSAGKNINYWKMSPENAGRWGTDYMMRAVAAWKYIYVNTPEEAVYFIVDRDDKGELLDGTDNYTITFTKEQIPQVKFFWSLTMYGDDGYLVENPIGRYNIKDRDDLIYGQDGSMTLYIQKESPGEQYESNWLPAPDGKFYMALRLYGASEDLIGTGNVDIPGVVKTE